MKLLIVCGPTAAGKTKLAITLAKKFNGELVNADSRQVYHGLDALTGKDRSQDVPIWLYDVIDADEEFSVAHFVRLATRAIDNIYARGMVPIVVGGTGFYLRALTTSIETIAVPPNPELRKTLRATSIEILEQQLRRIDPKRWGALNDSDRKNPRRLIRAIEVASSSKHIPLVKPKYDAFWIGLTAPLPVLKQRILERVAARFDKATREVRDGLPPLLGADLLLSWKRGEITKEETLTRWDQAEYQYAKRQLTWFRKEKQIHWFDVSDPHVEQRITDMVKSWYTLQYGYS